VIRCARAALRPYSKLFVFKKSIRSIPSRGFSKIPAPSDRLEQTRIPDCCARHAPETEAHLFRIFTRLLPLMLLCHLVSGSAAAQQPDRPPNLNLGDAVVTGFSGTISPDTTRPPPANKSAVDLTFINPDGPSARIVGVGRPGYVWDGRLFQAPKTFDVFAKDVGQVFGVALDDQPVANIYLAATSAFGLNLVGRGADGKPERRKIGGPGAGWMKGQFGLDLQGDPGSIYKVDGTTGVVSLFAKVMLDGVPNPGPALGNLAYDAAHKQLFVSDLYTGMIHRFAIADGSEPGTSYDHGVTGRAAANLAPVPFNPANRPNIANNRFNSENPDSWGFAPPERRVWGLAVQAGRLFYSVRNGSATEAPQIWSVGIAQDGSFGADPRLDVDVAAQPGPYPVSDIAFSQRGAMIVAQRAPIAASYDYSAFTKPDEPRMLRYWLKDANDPPSPGLWKPMPEEYAIGFAGTYRNTDGGVALGYGYGPDGMINTGTCDTALWTTGQNLRNNPALRSQLDPGGPLVVNGLQGSPADMVRSANEPPAVSYFIDYDDKFDDARASGHMGSVRILARPCAGQIADSGQPGGYPSSSPPYVSGPQTPPTTIPGCVGPNCTPCQFGTYPDGSCKPPIDLAIKKTASEAKFDEKTGLWTIQFTVIVTNAGVPFSPGGFINITDPIPAGLTVTSATGTGWSPCTGNLLCGYNYGPGVFNTGATLPPLVITVTTKTPGKYENCAVVGLPPSSGFHDTNLPNNKDCATVEVKYPPNVVTVAKVSPSEPCAVESICTFQIVVTNSSPWPFNGPITIGDNAGIPMNISSTDLPCNPAPTAIPFTCTGVVSLPPGVSSVTYTIVGVIPVGAIPVTTLTPKNCAMITQAPPITGFPSTIVVPDGPDCKPFTACGFACHMTQSQIDQIKIDKKADAAECSPGGLCSYTFTITNLSTTTATSTFPIAFIDTMPAGATTFVPPPVPAPWTCLPLGGNPDKIKCLYPPSSIPPGGHLTVVVTFQISPSYTESTLQNCSEFFIGQTAMAAAQRRSESAMDAATLRTYLQSRGISALPAAMTTPVLGPNDKSCTTVQIAQAGIKPCPPGTVLVGKECVKRTACLPPMIPGPIAGQCICPPGTVLSGKECVKPHICPPPFVMGPADQCICPPGTVQSGKECVKPHTCPPPLVMGPADQCICPPGTVLKGKECVKQETSCKPPMIPGPVAGQCVCPKGTVQQGRRCVPPIECRSPLIPNAAGTDCVCRPGLVQRGRRCVEPVVCKPPATLNRRGECQCPRDMVARGNSCVERERRTPAISPGDIIRNIPDLGRDHPRGGPDGPRGGGHVNDPPRGGGAINNAPRGGGRDTDPPRGGPGLDFPGRR
jgi:uncharacterized repeat protein (TIGR01451 family)